MSNEITSTMRITVANGEFSETIDDGTHQYDQAAVGAGGQVFSIGTSEEALTFTDVSTLGLCYMKNLDTANYVTYGPTSGGAMVAFGRIKAGERAWLRLEPGITFRGQANTAAVKLFIRVYEN